MVAGTNMKFFDPAFPALRKILRAILVAVVGSWFLSASSVVAMVWVGYFSLERREESSAVFVLVCKVLSIPSDVADRVFRMGDTVPHSPAELVAQVCGLHQETFLLLFFAILVVWPFVVMGRWVRSKFPRRRVE